MDRQMQVVVAMIQAVEFMSSKDRKDAYCKKIVDEIGKVEDEDDQFALTDFLDIVYQESFIR